MYRRFKPIVYPVVLAMAFNLAPVSGAVAQTSGPRALSGAEATAFKIPSDVVKLWQAGLANGLTQTRYQQRVAGANVLGGQLTVLRRGNTVAAVIGAHYPGLKPARPAVLDRAAARGIAQQRIGAGGRWFVRLMIDPADRHLFYRVLNARFDARRIFWVDAASGAVRNSFNALTTDGPGTGVKGDTKQLDTSIEGSTNVLRTSDSRQETHDIQNRRGSQFLPGLLMSDADDTWNLAGVESPGQPAGVDAHFYAGVVDEFYSTFFDRDSIDDDGLKIVSTVHYGHKYNNAFWNGNQMVYGDGDQRNFREFSGGLEVIGHELTHGVTQYTSNLIYQGESGALNESFSDIIGNTIENATNEPLSSNCFVVNPGTCNDWVVAEDLILNNTDTVAGFRNMADPQEDNDPDHYSELINDPSDGGGVHTNSGVPNHAYYLLVVGGKNAGCDTVGSGGHQHTADCSVTVPSIGLNNAAQIFYAGFTSLAENANMCDARNATVAAAVAAGTGFNDEVGLAWDAVGLHDGCTGSPPVPVCEFEVSSTPFESAHPYKSFTDCTWIYDNGTANFALHFSLLETEENFDYVFVYDGNGTELHQLTGVQSGFTTDCITTQTAGVRLVSDQLINDRGFIVDSAVPCT
jgi:Zn-dependent metalloprotease